MSPLALSSSHQALQRVTNLAARASARAWAAVERPEEERRQAGWARTRVLADLAAFLVQLETQASAHGIRVFWADGAQEANRLVIETLHAAGASKIMRNHAPILDEIDFDRAAAANNIAVTPLHLGDSLLQPPAQARRQEARAAALPDQRLSPGHPIWPAVHLPAATVGEIIQDRQRLPLMQDVDLLAAALRAPLRRELLGNSTAVLGLNFAVAETGSMVCLDTDGHNASLVAAAQDAAARDQGRLICLLSIEQVVADTADLHRLAAAYARSAWGCAYPPFVTQIQRAAPVGAAPLAIDLVLVDNGRSRILAEGGANGGAEILACIHCGACHAVCPIFPQLGAAGYGPSAYSGPAGAVLNPSLLRPGLAAAQPHLSTGCNACQPVCPVGIDLPALLHQQRQRFAAPAAGRGERSAFWLWQRLLVHPRLFFLALRLARRLRGA